MDSNAKLCEIAFIGGQLEAKRKVDFQGSDLHEMYGSVYVPIFKEWKYGMNKDIFKNEEEEGYITAYASRRLVELYGIK